MKCPYCSEFRGNSKVRGYPVKDQLIRHIEVKHMYNKHKEVWEMTLTEWLEDRKQASIKEGWGWSIEGANHAKHLHEVTVRNAVNAGIPVSPRVLADYKAEIVK